jgi:hypothetical protein
MKETFNLCKCNGCGSTLFDENPQSEAPKFELKGGELDMVQLKEETDGVDDEYYWACPICKTDDNLMDMY